MSGDCQKASKAIQSLFVELNNLDLDTILLAQLFQVRMFNWLLFVSLNTEKGQNSLLVCAHFTDLQFFCTIT